MSLAKGLSAISFKHAEDGGASWAIRSFAFRLSSWASASLRMSRLMKISEFGVLGMSANSFPSPFGLRQNLDVCLSGPFCIVCIQYMHAMSGLCECIRCLSHAGITAGLFGRDDEDAEHD